MSAMLKFNDLKRQYGIFFMNFTGIPTILEEMIVNEILASGKVPILLINKNNLECKLYKEDLYLKFTSQRKILKTYFFNNVKGIYDVLTSIIDRKRDDEGINSHPIYSQLGFSDVNFFNSTIYYDKRQFQVETNKEEYIVDNESFKQFFHTAKKIILDKKTKTMIKSYESGSLFEKLTVPKGNYKFDETIRNLEIRYKESTFCKHVFKDDLQIGRINQTWKDCPYLFSREVYESLMNS